MVEYSVIRVIFSLPFSYSMPSAQFTRTPEGLAAVEVLESSTTDETSMTFVFHDEDHTLGNALRHALQRK